eukprot:TRINITY_DN1706_c0_g1_i1.p1 TRINITY_DN1706_c0_g1~~TRINITY_DN1706_c0_g1_i1.p1  ORF type:complete len:332 (+),score=53.92 TRINITY_DN1706_c0_g1_i1:2032-3027(+)
MKVLVTGGSGFLGGCLVGHLLRHGYQVRALLRRTSRALDLPPQVEIVYGDVRDVQSLVAACQGCEVAVHAAALVQAWVPDNADFERVNVGGLRNMITAIRSPSSTIQRLVHVSSFFALGPTDGFVASEEQVHQGKTFTTEYERTKWLADGISREAIASGLPLVVVYPGAIYGPGAVTQGNLMVQLVLDHMKGKFPGYVGPGTNMMSLVHVDDVCEGIVAALEKGATGQRYLLTGENTTLTQVFNTLTSLTGKPAPKLHLPFWLCKVLGFVTVVLARIGGPTPVITPSSVNAFKHDWAYSSKRAEVELGYRYRNFKDGLTDTLTWLKSTGKL